MTRPRATKAEPAGRYQHNATGRTARAIRYRPDAPNCAEVAMFLGLQPAGQCMNGMPHDGDWSLEDGRWVLPGDWLVDDGGTVVVVPADVFAEHWTPR